MLSSNTYANVTTTDATPLNVVIHTLKPGEVFRTSVSVGAKTANGVVAAAIQITGSVKRNGSAAATVIGSFPPVASQKDSGATAWTAVAAVSGNDFVVTLTGAAATTITWTLDALASRTG